jgi:hypothetical protein
MTKAQQFRKRFGDPQPGSSAEPGKTPGTVTIEASLRTVQVFGKLRTTMSHRAEPTRPRPNISVTNGKVAPLLALVRQEFFRGPVPQNPTRKPRTIHRSFLGNDNCWNRYPDDLTKPWPVTSRDSSLLG